MMKYRARGTLIAVVACAFLLTACTTEAPTPTPTKSSTPASETSTPKPTDEKLKAPKTAEDAIDAAEASFQSFLGARNAAYQDPSKVSDLEKYSIGKALSRVTDEVRQVDEQGLTIEGDVGFEFTNGAAGPLKTKKGSVEFGTVTLKGCIDQTEVAGTRSDGSEAPKGEIQRYEIAPVIVFDAAEGRWVVFSFEEPELVVEC